MKKFGLIFCLVMLFNSVLLGTLVEIGDGNTTTNYVPLYGYFNYGWSTYILTSDQIGEAININRIKFNVSNTPSDYLTENQQIYMKLTSETQVTVDYPDPINNGFTLVFDGSVTWDGSGWHGITLDNDFAYDGILNLQIVWENNDGTFSNGYPTFFNTNTPNNQVAYKYDDDSFPVNSGEVSTFYPNTRFLDQNENELNPPTNLQAFLMQDFVELTWEVPNNTRLQESRGLLGFNIYRDEVQINEDVIAAETYNDDIMLGQIYSYYVTSVWDEGESGPSNVVEVGEVLELNPPTNLQGSFMQDIVELNWQAPDQRARESRELQGYNVYRDEVQINEGIVMDNFFMDFDLGLGGFYSYFVTALYDGSESDPSNTVVIEVPSNELIPDFEAFPTTVMIGDPIEFQNLSTPSDVAYYWDFGDGNSSFEENPYYSYFEAGVYTVSLTISNNNGEETEIKDDYITVNNLNNPPELILPESFTFEEDGSLEVDFSPYIFDEDQQDILILNGENGEFVNIEIQEYMVTFTSMSGWYGTETIYFGVDDQAGNGQGRVGNSRDMAFDSVEIIVTQGDTPIYIENQIDDILHPINSEEALISLNNRFADLDSEITSVVLTGNSNLSLVTTSVVDTLLTLSFTSDLYGTSELELTAYNDDEDQLSMTFTVEIYPIEFLDIPEFRAMVQNTKVIIDYSDYLYDPEQNQDQLSLSLADNSLVTHEVNGLELTLAASPVLLGSDNLNINVIDEVGRSITQLNLEFEIIDSYNAEFVADNTEILAGESVEFTDMTYGNPNHWAWYFDNDDVADSFLQHPTFNYYESGSYDVAFVVSYINEQNEIVASDSLMMEDYIIAEGTAVTGPGLPDNWLVANSPYNVFGELAIPLGDTLSIEPGTVVNIMGDSEFIVEGGLIADNIIFESPNGECGGEDGWQGIRFNSLSGFSRLTNSTIRHARVGIQIDGGSPHLSGIRIEGSYNNQPGMRIIGASQAVIDSLDIDGCSSGFEILGNLSGQTPSLTRIRIRRTSLSSRLEDDNYAAVKIEDSNLIIDDLDIEDFEKGIEIKSTYDASTPVLTNIRIRHTTNTSRTEDSFALKIEGNSSPLISNTEIDDFAKAIVIDALSSSPTPVLTNIRIRHTTNTSRSFGDTGIEFIGSINAEIDSLEIDDFITGISFENSDRIETITPTLTNIRIRHTTNTSRTDAVGLTSVGMVNLLVNGFETENVQDGIIMNSLGSTIPVLTNIRIRHTTNTSRELGGTGIQLLGLVEAVMDSIEVDDCLTGIYLENSTRTDATIPTLTNIRIRHTTNTSRTNAVGLKSVGVVNMRVNDFESENVQDGIIMNSSGSTIPVLTNIRIRHTTNTSRELGGTGIQLLGLVEAVMDSIEVDDCLTGIYLENSTRTETSIPTLTNIRIRHTTNTSRTEAIALKSVGLIKLKLTDFESENVHDGISLYSTDETIPVLTNIRIRHTTNTRENIGVGITLSEQANAWIINSLIEGFSIGLKASGNNNANIERNVIIDNLIAFDLNGADCATQIHHNHIENNLEELVTCFTITDIPDIQILNNNIFGFNRIVSGENSSPYFSQNIIWGAAIADADLASGELLAASFEYNDISMESGFAPGLANINEDPNFAESDPHNLELSIYSNCIDAGNPNLLPDPDGSIADLGMNYLHHLANYNSDSRFVTLGTPIQFANSSEGHDKEVTSILWDFGDGSSTTDRNPTHLFADTGIYTVTLTMTTGVCIDQVSRTGFVVTQEEAIPAPQNPSVTMTGSSINLAWEEITQTLDGSLITDITYLIYSCEDIDGVYEYRHSVTDLNWTDNNIGQQARTQFYFVLGFVGDDRSSLEEFIRTHNYLKRNGEVVNQISGIKLKHLKQIVK